MALPTISEGDLLNKGTTGMPANPELSVGDLQAKFDELSLDVIVPKFQALVTALENASAGADLGVTTPTGITASNKVKSVLDAMAVILLALKDKSDGDYDDLVDLFTGITMVSDIVDGLSSTIPTAKAITDFIQDIGGGDMLRAVYDTNNNGIVDNSEKLGGNLPEYFATQNSFDNAITNIGTWVNISSLIVKNFADLSFNALYNPATKEVKLIIQCGVPLMANKTTLLTVPVAYRPSNIYSTTFPNAGSVKINPDLSVADWKPCTMVVYTDGTIKPTFTHIVDSRFLQATFSYIAM